MEKIIIFDFGSQYTQLIARRLRELNVYCEIHPYNKSINFDKVRGVILSGSPSSVLSQQAPQINMIPFLGKLPVLAVCYGAQYITQHFGGRVEASKTREYGRAILKKIDTKSKLFIGLEPNREVWMSHADTIVDLPEGASIIASTEDVNIAGYEILDKYIYALQFHPEVYHSQQGKELLKNFIDYACKMKPNWTPKDFISSAVSSIKEQVKSDKVVMAISGGVDSTVAAMLISKAIGDRLYCIFVDNGLLRKDEYTQVLDMLSHLHLNVKGVDAKELFYSKLKGLTNPEEKRKAIGSTFIEVFNGKANQIGGVSWLAQGTIYPDVIESVSLHGGPSQTIKSHHNVGGLPERMDLKILEPLRLLFKDEVRRIGKELELPHRFLGRHPFPGPGLGIRILGDVTQEKVNLLQQADAIYIEHLQKSGWYDKVWQAGTIFLPVKSVGVMGDERTYESAVALRAVSSTDGMTADWVHLPSELLAKISNDIINKVKGINRVVYDISSKPPSTIEWE